MSAQNAIRYIVNSAPSSFHKLQTFSSVRLALFTCISRETATFQFTYFFYEWNAYIKTLRILKKKLNTAQLYRQSYFGVFGAKEKDLREGRAHAQR